MRMVSHHCHATDRCAQSNVWPACHSWPGGEAAGRMLSELTELAREELATGGLRQCCSQLICHPTPPHIGPSQWCERTGVAGLPWSFGGIGCQQLDSGMASEQAIRRPTLPQISVGFTVSSRYSSTRHIRSASTLARTAAASPARLLHHPARGKPLLGFPPARHGAEPAVLWHARAWQPPQRCARTQCCPRPARWKPPPQSPAAGQARLREAPS